MKNKFTTIAFLGALLTTSAVFAMEGGEGDREENRAKYFAEHKAKMVANLNKEKSAIDSMISCVNSAQKKEDMERCREQKKASMEKLHQEREAERKAKMAEQKAHLQEKMNKLDAEMNSSGDKPRK